MAGIVQSALTPDSIVETADRLILDGEADARDWS